MIVVSYNECPDSATMIATVSVYIQEWHMTINNIAIIKSKHGGWFVAMPTYKNKNTEAWDKTVLFDLEAHKKFTNTLHEVISEYAESNNIKLAQP